MRYNAHCFYPLQKKVEFEIIGSHDATIKAAREDPPRIGVKKALNRHVEQVFDPSRKDIQA